MTFWSKNHPLLSDLDTFWFGDEDDLESFRWSQVTGSSFIGSACMSVAWQGRSVSSQAPLTLSLVASWADPDTPPVLSISEFVRPDSVRPDSILTLRGSATHGSDQYLYLLAVINDFDDICVFTIAATSDLNESWTTRDLKLTPGENSVRFYAASSMGAVSDPSPSFQVFAQVPSASPRPHSRSPVPSSSPARSPLPGTLSVTAAAARSTSNFELTVRLDGGRTLGISAQGFSTILKSSDQQMALSQLHILKNDTIHIKGETGITIVGAAADICIKVTNGASVEQVAGVSIQAVLNITGVSSLSATDLQGTGFRVEGGNYQISFLSSDHPLLSNAADNATNYWFGDPVAEPDFGWSQASTESYEAPTCGMSISSESLELPGYGSNFLCAIVRVGPGSTPPNLTLDSDFGPSAVLGPGDLEFTGLYQDDDGDSGSIVVVFDRDPTLIVTAAEGIAAGASFRARANPRDLKIERGNHTVEVYAVDSTGMFSSPSSFSVTARVEPSSTPLPSPTDQFSPGVDAYRKSGRFLRGVLFVFLLN
jgi:hypothetical protein